MVNDCLRNVPVSTRVERCDLFLDHWKAVAATTYVVTGKRRTVFGFGCSKCPRQAELSAVGELHERLWSLMSLHSNDDMLKLETLNGEPRGWIEPRVALGLIASQDHLSVSSDATGIAFHLEKGSAVNHGLNEIFERHTTSRIWNGLTEVDNHSVLDTSANGVLLHLFTIGGLPYCLAMCISEHYLAFGAKAASCVQAARDGAIAEAIMVYDRYQPILKEKARRPSYPERHQQKMSILDTKQGRQKVVEHLMGRYRKINCGQATAPPMNSDTFMTRYSITHDEFRVASFVAPSGYCVRVIPRFNVFTARSKAAEFKLPML